MPLLDILGIDLPIIQAPMAGVSTPAMAAAVAEAGALGSIGVGATDAAGAQRMIEAVRQRSTRSLNVNVFCHQPARPDGAVDSAWITRLQPYFQRFGAQPPAQLREIYRSFIVDDEMLAMLLRTRPRVVSFHFGLPPAQHLRALRDAGIVLLASATNPAEARAAAAAGVNAIIAQGYEAGGHRGVVDPAAPDAALSTGVLTRLLVRELAVPVIAAGGIMDGAGIAAVLRLGASAAQLGTAFIACAESDADVHFRRALASDAAHHTVMTRAISGRPARCLGNAFTALGEGVEPQRIPSYPLTYDAGKALNQAAKAAGNGGFGAQWAGQGAPLARTGLGAAQLVAALAGELRAVLS
ncbi:MAG TPA: nitronate monooxygenase [Steroidobacteraceae bacterium]|nr:nitronate monooxygenase [Steroidobacteraceae bacterium]